MSKVSYQINLKQLHYMAVMAYKITYKLQIEIQKNLNIRVYNTGVKTKETMCKSKEIYVRIGHQLFY